MEHSQQGVDIKCCSPDPPADSCLIFSTTASTMRTQQHTSLHHAILAKIFGTAPGSLSAILTKLFDRMLPAV